MQAKRLSIIQAIQFGFSKTIDNFGILFSALFLRWILWLLGYFSLTVLISGAIMPIRMMIYERGVYPITNSFSLAILLMITCGVLLVELADSIISLGLIQMMLNIYDKKTVRLSVLFSKWHLVIKNMILTFMITLIILVGMALFILPGLYLAVRLGFAYQLLVDKELEPWQALKMSFKLTQGHWFSLFGLWFIFLLINLAGACCFMIGLLITIPSSF